MDVAELFEKAEKLRGTENLDEAVEKYREVIAVAEDSFFKAESLHMIGLIYYQQNKLEEAENYLKEAEDSFVKLKNDAMRAAVLRDLAIVFVAGNDLDKAEALLLEREY